MENTKPEVDVRGEDNGVKKISALEQHEKRECNVDENVSKNFVGGGGGGGGGYLFNLLDRLNNFKKIKPKTGEEEQQINGKCNEQDDLNEQEKKEENGSLDILEKAHEKKKEVTKGEIEKGEIANGEIANGEAGKGGVTKAEISKKESFKELKKSEQYGICSNGNAASTSGVVSGVSSKNVHEKDEHMIINASIELKNGADDKENILCSNENMRNVKNGCIKDGDNNSVCNKSDVLMKSMNLRGLDKIKKLINEIRMNEEFYDEETNDLMLLYNDLYKCFFENIDYINVGNKNVKKYLKEEIEKLKENSNLLSHFLNNSKKEKNNILLNMNDAMLNEVKRSFYENFENKLKGGEYYSSEFEENIIKNRNVSTIFSILCRKQVINVLEEVYKNVFFPTPEQFDNKNRIIKRLSNMNKLMHFLLTTNAGMSGSNRDNCSGKNSGGVGSMGSINSNSGENCKSNNNNMIALENGATLHLTTAGSRGGGNIGESNNHRSHVVNTKRETEEVVDNDDEESHEIGNKTNLCSLSNGGNKTNKMNKLNLNKKTSNYFRKDNNETQISLSTCLTETPFIDKKLKEKSQKKKVIANDNSGSNTVLNDKGTLKKMLCDSGAHNNGGNHNLGNTGNGGNQHSNSGSGNANHSAHGNHSNHGNYNHNSHGNGVSANDYFSDMMVYISWVPKSARCQYPLELPKNSAERNKLAEYIEAKEQMLYILKLMGYEEIDNIYFHPPKGSHIKIKFKTLTCMNKFLKAYKNTPDKWKEDMFNFFNIPLRSSISVRDLRIERAVPRSSAAEFKKIKKMNKNYQDLFLFKDNYNLCEGNNVDKMEKINFHYDARNKHIVIQNTEENNNTPSVINTIRSNSNNLNMNVSMNLNGNANGSNSGVSNNQAGIGHGGMKKSNENRKNMHKMKGCSNMGELGADHMDDMDGSMMLNLEHNNSINDCNSRGFNGSGFNGSGFNGSGFNGNGFNGSGFNGSSFNGSGFNNSSFNNSGYNDGTTMHSSVNVMHKSLTVPGNNNGNNDTPTTMMMSNSMIDGKNSLTSCSNMNNSAKSGSDKIGIHHMNENSKVFLANKVGNMGRNMGGNMGSSHMNSSHASGNHISGSHMNSESFSNSNNGSLHNGCMGNNGGGDGKMNYSINHSNTMFTSRNSSRNMYLLKNNKNINRNGAVGEETASLLSTSTFVNSNTGQSIGKDLVHNGNFNFKKQTHYASFSNNTNGNISSISDHIFAYSNGSVSGNVNGNSNNANVNLSSSLSSGMDINGIVNMGLTIGSGMGGNNNNNNNNSTKGTQNATASIGQFTNSLIDPNCSKEKNFLRNFKSCYMGSGSKGSGINGGASHNDSNIGGGDALSNCVHQMGSVKVHNDGGGYCYGNGNYGYSNCGSGKFGAELMKEKYVQSEDMKEDFKNLINIDFINDIDMDYEDKSRNMHENMSRNIGHLQRQANAKRFIPLSSCLSEGLLGGNTNCNVSCNGNCSGNCNGNCDSSNHVKSREYGKYEKIPFNNMNEVSYIMNEEENSNEDMNFNENDFAYSNANVGNNKVGNACGMSVDGVTCVGAGVATTGVASPDGYNYFAEDKSNLYDNRKKNMFNYYTNAIAHVANSNMHIGISHNGSGNHGCGGSGHSNGSGNHPLVLDGTSANDNFNLAEHGENNSHSGSSISSGGGSGGMGMDMDMDMVMGNGGISSDNNPSSLYRSTLNANVYMDELSLNNAFGKYDDNFCEMKKKDEKRRGEYDMKINEEGNNKSFLNYSFHSSRVENDQNFSDNYVNFF
ncbi:asparagine-rich protein, putative [Plasmodium ovale]|uniref:Asparagine-rich protein, putative n=2 Tax=Plasmodium ovale TaxID=36330 RepID=A0A1A8X9M7_PLAOA|nr:asparagine-rich protein, putative [Plasmodium ovale curtisi]SCQ17130.1 asparagine-rich protein, putative [Plasmodium ovale]